MRIIPSARRSIGSSRPDNHSSHIDYVLLYPTNRLRSPSLPALQPDLPVTFGYIAGQFNGNTSQTLAVYFSPPGCLRVLDPDIEKSII